MTHGPEIAQPCRQHAGTIRAQLQRTHKTIMAARARLRPGDSPTRLRLTRKHVAGLKENQHVRVAHGTQQPVEVLQVVGIKEDVLPQQSDELVLGQAGFGRGLGLVMREESGEAPL
eukprot:COSAG02_NODE_297_length_25355_cov_78.632998_13_plen_116_part_00